MTHLRSMMAVSMASVFCACGALAQTNATFVFTSSNTVSPATPTTTIGIWAAWDDPNRGFVFTGAEYDLTTGEGFFTNPVNVLQGPGSTTGVIAANVISGGINGQLHIPFLFFGSQDNPILLATYDWTTTDFSPRDVNLETSNTTNFIVAANATGATTELFPQAFTPGSGTITVVPAPATWLAPALPLAAATRRRRVNGPNAKQD
jgi:hypothetical protein